jgi:hypothetical protein
MAADHCGDDDDDDNKPDIMIRNNEKGSCMFIDVAISGDRNVIKKKAEKILKYKHFTIEIQRMWNVKKCDTSNNGGNWNRLKVIHKIPEQHNKKARNQGTTDDSHIGH